MSLADCHPSAKNRGILHSILIANLNQSITLGIAIMQQLSDSPRLTDWTRRPAAS